MGLVPYERSLVNRLEGKPFVLLGVNTDREVEWARRAIATEGINWRSWVDSQARGGPISLRWHVHQYPTFYLIDQKGIIRGFHPYSPNHEELEEAIHALLKKVR
jgi:hypothetical protein